MKKKLPLLTSTAYFAPAHWYVNGLQQEGWVIQAKENYQKGRYRNRCRIVGPNGLQTLTVPLVKGKHQQTAIQEVAISYHTDWQRQHEQSIRTAYGRAPYFEFYAEAVFTVLRQPFVTLFELNRALHEAISKSLQYPVTRIDAEDFIPSTNDAYLRPEALPQSLADYPQVFTERHGFTPGLSILDALFCLGPGTQVQGLAPSNGGA